VEYDRWKSITKLGVNTAQVTSAKKSHICTFIVISAGYECVNITDPQLERNIIHSEHTYANLPHRLAPYTVLKTNWSHKKWNF